MNRPLNWFVVALSLAFLMAGRAMAPRMEPAGSAFVGGDVERISSSPVPVARAQTLPFELSTRAAVPASVRRERNLDFGYVRLESQQN
jgi:hypothetical protein